ncbi:OmpA family protein [Corallococcus sp. H22C18031201]|uniref:OmpA family protein n=1 Tax=Citreicoccus inhibens TaxID=2849499 RepID=UPI000E75AA86|nr:OmpA family protein [Citreicoccus inhibens]MBU8898400.1 OmpA family protein [Citreicoccus inhibens]RJS15403.1 OmpA family protein [Corallococcus sp. H22C18031201]
MKLKALCIAVSLLAVPGVAGAQGALDQFKKAAGDAGKATVEKRVNTKLLDEARKNQCSFKTGTAELAPGCGDRLKKLTAALVDAKKQLDGAGAKSYTFEVAGHTDSTGDAAKNKKLSEDRAETIVKELVARGIPRGEIKAVGYGSEKLLVKPDNTEAKKAKNRRYEVQVRL